MGRTKLIIAPPVARSRNAFPWRIVFFTVNMTACAIVMTLFIISLLRAADDLASVGSFVLRSGLATNLLLIGALKFKEYEVENIDPLVRSSPLSSRLREKLGARRLARVIGSAEIALGSVIAAKPVAPKASAAASLGAVGMFLTTLSFLVTTPEASQEGEGRLVPSPVGQFLLKDIVLLAAALLTAAESLRAADR